MKLLLSHVADLDGVTPVILSNLVGLDFEYELFDLNELNEFISNKLDSNYFDKYDDIIITDLSVSKSVADKIVGSIYKDKLYVGDISYTKKKPCIIVARNDYHMERLAN